MSLLGDAFAMWPVDFCGAAWSLCRHWACWRNSGRLTVVFVDLKIWQFGCASKESAWYSSYEWLTGFSLPRMAYQTAYSDSDSNWAGAARTCEGSWSCQLQRRAIAQRFVHVTTKWHYLRSCRWWRSPTYPLYSRSELDSPSFYVAALWCCPVAAATAEARVAGSRQSYYWSSITACGGRKVAAWSSKES